MRNPWSCLLFNAVLTLLVIALPVPAMPQSAVATSEATPACKDEKGCIKQFPNVFLRKKNVLWLKLQNGKAKTLTIRMAMHIENTPWRRSTRNGMSQS